MLPQERRQALESFDGDSSGLADVAAHLAECAALKQQGARARRAGFPWLVFLLAVAACAIFVRSPFGAALTGTRDQPRRMNALGFHVWMIRFWAFMFSGLLSSVSGILFIYYYEFISPPALALTSSAEVLLMVISGGAGTLLGPAVGASLVVIIRLVVSAYISRWNFMLGAIFVAIVVFMPEGLVPGTVRLARTAWRAAERRNLLRWTAAVTGQKS